MGHRRPSGFPIGNLRSEFRWGRRGEASGGRAVSGLQHKEEERKCGDQTMCTSHPPPPPASWGANPLLWDILGVGLRGQELRPDAVRGRSRRVLPTPARAHSLCLGNTAHLLSTCFLMITRLPKWSCVIPKLALEGSGHLHPSNRRRVPAGQSPDEGHRPTAGTLNSEGEVESREGIPPPFPSRHASLSNVVCELLAYCVPSTGQVPENREGPPGTYNSVRHRQGSVSIRQFSQC